MYGAKSVKKALRKAQNDKCVFCESKVAHVAYGDVEHFRLKGGHRQQKEDPLGRPGYYWLAYEWTNLFFACQLCNQRYKKNLFPLLNPATRARPHHDDIESEEPFFIDPATVDPTEHIGFLSEYVYPIDDSELGNATIGLNREELVEQRRDRLSLFQRLKEIRRLLSGLIESGDPTSELADQQQQNDAEIVRLRSSATQYASMARPFFIDAEDEPD